MKDVWYSPDGENWAAATLDAPWPGRFEHTSVVHDGKMWVIGGRNSDHLWGMSDVWYSDDGRIWTSATLSAPWGPRCRHASFVFGGSMWVIRGAGVADAWHSTDGTSWTLVPGSWGSGMAPSVVAYRDAIWVFSPEAARSSSDKDFVLHHEHFSVPWGDRRGHTLLVYDDRVWMMGGLRSNAPLPGYRLMNDVWCFDGVAWEQVTAYADWSVREQHTAVAFQDKIWILGGKDTDYLKNDIWYTQRETATDDSWKLYR